MNKLFSHRILHFRFFIIGCLLVACAPHKATVPTHRETLDPVQLFDQKLESMRKTLSIPGMSVAVLKEQEIVFDKGYGYADIENKIRATENTPYGKLQSGLELNLRCSAGSKEGNQAPFPKREQFSLLRTWVKMPMFCSP